MKMWIMIISVSLIVFLAGCVKQKPEVQFKNDVITIENYVVDNVAPYSSTKNTKNKVTISFNIKNNGDKPVKWVEVNFFDASSFIVDSTSLICKEFGAQIKNEQNQKCVFGDKTKDDPLKFIEPLDTREVSFSMETPRGITSPTPFTVSFSVTYRYGSIKHENTYLFSGERSAVIPVIDPSFKKEPTSKFSQSEPTVGPIVFDIVPSLEREKVVDGKTIKEYWAVYDIESPRSFQTKFVMKKTVSEGTLKNIEPPAEKLYIDCRTENKACINIQLTNLFINDTQTCNFNHLPTTGMDMTKGMANKIVNEKNNTLVCSFMSDLPSGFASEFTGTVTIQYNYDYEIIRKQNFAVYPAIS